MRRFGKSGADVINSVIDDRAYYDKKKKCGNLEKVFWTVLNCAVVGSSSFMFLYIVNFPIKPEIERSGNRAVLHYDLQFIPDETYTLTLQERRTPYNRSISTIVNEFMENKPGVVLTSPLDEVSYSHLNDFEDRLSRDLYEIYFQLNGYQDFVKAGEKMVLISKIEKMERESSSMPYMTKIIEIANNH